MKFTKILCHGIAKGEVSNIYVIKYLSFSLLTAALLLQTKYNGKMNAYSHFRENKVVLQNACQICKCMLMSNLSFWDARTVLKVLLCLLWVGVG